MARADAEAEGVGDRVSFVVRDVAAEGLDARYELVAVFGTLHELGGPVEALGAMRAALAEDGVLLVVDAATDAFAAPGGNVERFLEQWSVLFHLPVTMRDGLPSPGRLLDPETLRHYARQAGFARVNVIPIRSQPFRMYRLIP